MNSWNNILNFTSLNDLEKVFWAIYVFMFAECSISYWIYHVVLLLNTVNPILGVVSLHKEATSEWDDWPVFHSYISFTITLFSFVRNLFFIRKEYLIYSVCAEHFEFSFAINMWNWRWFFCVINEVIKNCTYRNNLY